MKLQVFPIFSRSNDEAIENIMEQTGSGIKILAVSNELSVLTELEGVLKKVLPLADVIKETDPLMACKYSFNNEVNYVFASENMRRMSGSDLLQFIKKEHPAVKTYLFFKENASLSATFYDETVGVINYPFSSEEVTRTLAIDCGTGADRR